MLQVSAKRQIRPTMAPFFLEPTKRADEWAPLSCGSIPLAFATPTGKMLIIGDELQHIVQRMHEVTSLAVHPVPLASTGSVGLDRVSSHSPDVILLDLCLPDQSGLDVLQQIRRINPRIAVICVTRERGAGSVIEAIKQGAYDCLASPIDASALRQVVHEALDLAHRTRQSSTVDATVVPADAECGMIGLCASMGEVYKAIGRVAAQNVPVLITGESGTGKELVARAIYAHGPRAQKPFLALNCAAMPENLLESELFGHEKGAFTGADRRRIGKFEQCNGGTIFLDEIGDMPLALQAKILRLLQEQTFERVGGNETIHTDVRIIAATNRDLRAWSLDGRFRPDLYYRLGVFAIHLPPLRERGDDLAFLVQHFVQRFGPELGRDTRQIAPETMQHLKSYSWPGNIRELQSVLKQALLRATGPVLLPEFLPKSLGEPGVATSAVPASMKSGEVMSSRIGPDLRDLYAKAHRDVDRQLLPRVLRSTRGNVQQAALILGIARQTLRSKLRELGIAVSRVVEAEEAGDKRMAPV